jgi:hypothetical protein
MHYPLSSLTGAIGHDATTLFGTYYTHRIADDGIYFPISEDYASGCLTPQYSDHLWASSERPPQILLILTWLATLFPVHDRRA